MRRLSMVLAIVALAGCSKDGVQATLGPTDANVVGSYSLSTSNGRPLPLIVRLTGDEEWDLTSDNLVLVADNTWVETSNYTITQIINGATSTSQSRVAGTFSIANNQINFVMTSGGAATFTGSVSGNSLSLLFNGGTFLYLR